MSFRINNGGVDWEGDIDNEWDALCKQEDDPEKCYAVTLSVATFALLPAFLQLLNTFVGIIKNDDGYGNQIKKVILLSTIASYIILGTAAWRATCFMREDLSKRVFFYWGFALFCNEAALLSMLVLWYQNHLEENDRALLKLTCNIWMVSGISAALGSVVSYLETYELNMNTTSLVVGGGGGGGEEEEEEEEDSNELKINKEEQETTPKKTCTRNSFSYVLLVSGHTLLLGFMDIAYHAHFEYNEPWMAIAAVVAYMQLIVAAMCLRVPSPTGEEDKVIMEMKTLAMLSSLGAVVYGAYLLFSLDQEEEDSDYRSFGYKLYCVLPICCMLVAASSFNYASSKAQADLN